MISESSALCAACAQFHAICCRSKHTEKQIGEEYDVLESQHPIVPTTASWEHSKTIGRLRPIGCLILSDTCPATGPLSKLTAPRSSRKPRLMEDCLGKKCSASFGRTKIVMDEIIAP
mmetsp:Transcript_12391/g.26019  ORF Transcript_12391/g.26019 Transcript_12391/m.26019 type:complete len:117 (-) Transcript_12391:651-1001(-)